MFAVKEKPADKFPAQIVVDVFRLIGYVISKSCWFIRYEGRNNIPDKSSGPILIAANHQTYIDPVWICLPMRRRIRYMAIGNAFNWPFVGKLIRYLGAFPVSAEPSGTVGAMKEALKTLRAGAVLTIFPEGARSFEDGKMIPFKTGVVAHRLAGRRPGFTRHDQRRQSDMAPKTKISPTFPACDDNVSSVAEYRKRRFDQSSRKS